MEPSGDCASCAPTATGIVSGTAPTPGTLDARHTNNDGNPSDSFNLLSNVTNPLNPAFFTMGELVGQAGAGSDLTMSYLWLRGIRCVI
jgi:hypothetical protein